MKADDKPDAQMSRHKSRWRNSPWGRSLSDATSKTHNQVLKKHASAKRRRRDRTASEES